MRLLRLLPLVTMLAGAIPPAVVAQLDNAARLLDQGNLHFRDGNFDEARTSYEEALSLGFESGAVYYNLGNAYFRLDRLGKAMLNYQRAARFLRDDPALTHNMDLVRSRARDQLSVLPRPIWAKWWNGMVDRIGVRALFWSGVFAWLAGVGLAGRRLLTGTWSAVGRRLSAFLVAIGLLAGSGAVATSVARSDNVSAVVTSARADVLEEPSNSSRTAVVIHEALVLDVLELEGHWVHVRLPNGVVGFVERETIETI